MKNKGDRKLQDNGSHDEGGKLVWRHFEAASMPGMSGSVLRLEVMAEEPTGASWMLSVFVKNQSAILASGTEETMDQAKAVAWATLMRTLPMEGASIH